jgi:hypothetical protein
VSVASAYATNIPSVVQTFRITVCLERLHTSFLELDRGKVIDYARFVGSTAFISFPFKAEANDWWMLSGFKQYILWKLRQ